MVTLKWLGASAALIAIAVAGGVLYVHHTHTASNFPAQATGAPSPTATSSIPSTKAVAYELPAPSKMISVQTRTYLRADGNDVIALHREASTIGQQFSATVCRSAQKLITNGITQEIAGIPDPVLQELVLDEVHEIAAQGNCKMKQDSANLDRVVGVTAERLRQLGVAS